MPRNMSTAESKTEGRKGLGLRFWNFLDRATVGPSSDTEVGRRSGARI